MNKWYLFVSVSILILGFMIMPSTGKASSFSEAEKLVQKAENAASMLKWEISLEYRKLKYAEPITSPNMKLYNDTKRAKQLADEATKNLSTQEKNILSARLASNVDIHLTRSMAYIDAIQSGKKILVKTDALNSSYKLDPFSAATEKAYHDLSSEIRKQAILLYRVYGKSTRDAILDKYKSPGEKARQSAIHVISSKLEMEKLQQAIANGIAKEELLFSVQQIEVNIRKVEDEKARALLQTQLDEAKKSILEKDMPVKDEFFFLSDLVREVVIHPSQPIIYALNEKKDVLAINFETGETKRLSMNLETQTIYYQNNELYVGLLKGIHSPFRYDQEGAIAIIDTNSFTLAEQFDTNIDPFDIVADDKSIYVSSGSGQWTTIQGYSRETLLETSEGHVYSESYIEMHPSFERIYSIDTTLSPRIVKTHLVVDGKLTPGYDTAYQGNYRLQKNMSISPDGKYIFNGSGVIMASSDHSQINMKYLTKLPTSFEQITYNLNEGFFYTSNKNNLEVYNYATMEKVTSHALSGNIQHIFYQDGKLIVVTIEELYSTKLPTYAIKMYKVEGSKVTDL